MSEPVIRIALQFTDRHGKILYFTKVGQGFHVEGGIASASLYSSEEYAWAALERGYDWLDKDYRVWYPKESFKPVKIELRLIKE